MHTGNTTTSNKVTINSNNYSKRTVYTTRDVTFRQLKDRTFQSLAEPARTWLFVAFVREAPFNLYEKEIQ